MKKIPLIKPEIDAKNLIKKVKKIAQTGMLTKGEFIKEFQEGLAKYLGTKHVFAVSSCTTALHLSLLVAGIKSGDEVLVSDFSFPASANAIIYTGAEPVFVDIDLKSFCMDPADLVKKITKKSKAILVVHAFGNPADMTEINKIAKANKLIVIEDAACAIGSKHKNKFCGTWGEIGCFSFHPRKILTTGEGGAVVTDNSKIVDQIEILRDHGSIRTDHGLEFVQVGYNYRLSELQAALGVDQLRTLNQTIKTRTKLARKYIRELSEIKGITAPAEPKDGVTNFQSFVILLSEKIDRDDLGKFLYKNNIESVLGTYAMHAEPAYKNYGYKPGDLPNSFFAYKHSLTLPLFGQMKEAEINYVVNKLKEYLAKYLVKET